MQFIFQFFGQLKKPSKKVFGRYFPFQTRNSKYCQVLVRCVRSWTDKKYYILKQRPSTVKSGLGSLSEENRNKNHVFAHLIRSWAAHGKKNAQPDSNRERSVSQPKSLTTKLYAHYLESILSALPVVAAVVRRMLETQVTL